MTKIQKRRENCNTISDVIVANTGLSISDFFNTEKEYYIKDIDKVAKLLADKAKSNEHITVVGDYDADGICATAILSLVFNEMGWNFSTRLPKRFSEGYGLSEKIVDEINEGILLTVDNGITAFNEIKKAKEKGLTVIVTDHHLPDAESPLPPADIIIDPNAIKNSASFNGYCGAGIAYRLGLEILGKNHPLIPKLLTLACVATVADVMPLLEENRQMVKKGLSDMLNKKDITIGLSSILDKFSLSAYISAKDIGFRIAPAINAPGRMMDNGAELSLELLTSDTDYKEAQNLAETLFQFNEERKNIKNSTVKYLKENIKENGMEKDCPLIVYERGLPDGLIGIFAGNLAEDYKCPCIVFTDTDEDGILKGSGRSYGNINIKELLDKHNDLIEQYGGHAEALGVSRIKEENLNKLRKSLQEDLKEYNRTEDNTLYYDLEINAEELPNYFLDIERFAPFGQGNPDIVFYIKNFPVSSERFLQGGETVKLVSKYATAIGFGMGNEYKEMDKPKYVDLIGTLSKNSFMGTITKQVEIQKIIKKEEKTFQTEFMRTLESLS